MDSKFDMRRFLMLLRLDVMADRKYAVRLFFGFTLVYFLCFFPVFGASMVRGQYPPEVLDKVVETWAVLFMGISVAFCVVSPSFVCSTLRDKQRAQAFFLLPASPLEKFLARYIESTLGFLVILLCAILASDALRLLAGVVLGQQPYAALSGAMATVAARAPGWLMSKAGGSLMVCSCVVFFLVMVFLVYQALFLLGGVVLRRWAWLMVSLVVLAFQFGAGLSPAGVVYAVVDAGRVSDALGFVALLCLLAAVAALYWLSYRLFCRTQIVGHKWFSL